MRLPLWMKPWGSIASGLSNDNMESCPYCYSMRACFRCMDEARREHEAEVRRMEEDMRKAFASMTEESAEDHE